MGPNESQLRAALREGEGESPDAGSLIFHARQVRRERRRRAGSIATGVAVVGLVVGGFTALATNGSHEQGGASGGGGYAAGSAGAAGSTDRLGNAKAPALGASAASESDGQKEQLQAHAEAATRPCPTSASHYMLPGGGGINDFGSDGKLFAGNVVSLKLCGYPSVASAPRTKVLDGSAATQLVATLESAPSVAGGGGKCTETPVNGKVEILAVNTQHKALKPVVITLGCPTSQATNGTAVRYEHGLPELITSLLR